MKMLVAALKMLVKADTYQSEVAVASPVQLASVEQLLLCMQ
jgi:hypothetical protein